jgi:hypothetical protein
MSLSYIPKEERDELRALVRVLATRAWMLLRRLVSGKPGAANG